MVTEPQGDSNLQGRLATAKSRFLRSTHSTKNGRIELLKMIIAKVAVNARHFHLRRSQKQ